MTSKQTAWPQIFSSEMHTQVRLIEIIGFANFFVFKMFCVCVILMIIRSDRTKGQRLTRRLNQDERRKEGGGCR